MRKRWLLVLIFLLLVVGLDLTLTAAQTCPPDGNVDEMDSLTPNDALLAFKHFLRIADPPLTQCQQERANIDQPLSSEVTSRDALCIFQKFLGLSACDADFILDQSLLDAETPRIR